MLPMMRVDMTKAATPLSTAEGKVSLRDLANFKYSPRELNAFNSHIRTLVRAYHPVIGPYIDDHQQRAGNVVENFFEHSGYDKNFAIKIGDAVRLHDIGKIIQPVVLWDMSIDKKQRTADDMKARTEHGAKGAIVIDNVASELGINITPNIKAFFDLAKTIQSLHHERLNGTGPLGMTGDKFDEILEYIMIFDTVDGKFKGKKSVDEIFIEMADPNGKHAGQYDPEKVLIAQAFFETKPSFIPPALAL